VGTALAQNAAETAFWNRVRDSTNANELRAYLEAYDRARAGVPGRHGVTA